MNSESVIESEQETTSEELKIEPVADESNIPSTEESVPDIDSALEDDSETNSRKKWKMQKCL